jgi:plasmid stabilization system protein ParE
MHKMAYRPIALMELSEVTQLGGKRRGDFEHPFHSGGKMPRGDKSKYTDRQKRKAEHIEEGYEERGFSPARAKQIGWATVNKEEGGGNKSGSGRGVKDTHVSSKRGGHIAMSKRTHTERSRAAKKAAATRKRHQHRKAA